MSADYPPWTDEDNIQDLSRTSGDDSASSTSTLGEMGPHEISPIMWPKKLSSRRTMTYEALCLLYTDKENESIISFAMAASRPADEKDLPEACLHKVDIIESDSLKQSLITVKHEAEPRHGTLTDLITVSDKLRIASFDSGCVIPIKNFGPRKTFHCDVLSGLREAEAVNLSIAANRDGTIVATGDQRGFVVLYKIDGESLQTMARVKTSNAQVTGVTFVKSEESLDNRDTDLIFTLHTGQIGRIDTCVRKTFRSEFIHTLSPRANISSVCSYPELPGRVICIGTTSGQVASIDLRDPCHFVNSIQATNGLPISRVKPIRIKQAEKSNLYFIGFTQESDTIGILNASTFERDDRWVCDRKSEGKIKDFDRVRDRIITCGEDTAIGCWIFKRDEPIPEVTSSSSSSNSSSSALITVVENLSSCVTPVEPADNNEGT